VSIHVKPVSKRRFRNSGIIDIILYVLVGSNGAIYQNEAEGSRQQATGRGKRTEDRR
jgi:hypothetical protein